MYCENCGKSIPDDTVYCPLCGTQQGKAANPQSSPAAPPPLPPPPYSPPQRGTYVPPSGYSAPPGPSSRHAPLTTGQYMGMLILLWIPLLNFILLLVWSFGDVNQNRKNLSRAMLLLLILSIVLMFVVVAASGGIAAVLSEMR